MELSHKAINLPKMFFLTGVAFVIGGFFRTGLELVLGQENFFMIFMAIWLGFLVEASIGIAALAWLLKGVYPFRKLWLAGTGAFAAGVLFPALLINQFFFTLLVFPGFLIGLFFSKYLHERFGRDFLVLSITLGFLVCQVLFTLSVTIWTGCCGCISVRERTV